MHKATCFLILLFSWVWISCEKDLNITDFEEEFGSYRPELKVEGLLQQDRPEDSIIRIIKTSTIADSDLYNGSDDDGDGDIDELDEILPLVQDTSATVTVTHLNSGVVTEFQYVAVADSAVRFEEDEGDGEDILIVPYGGYKPVSSDFEIESYARYRLDVYSRAFDKSITGETTVYPPVEFIDTLYSFSGNQLVMHVDDEKEIFWKSDLAVTAYYLRYEEMELTGGDEREVEFLDSYSSSRDNDLTERYQAVSIGRTTIFGVNYPTVLQLTVEALSPAYGRYLFSDLPLKDHQRSNLRDEAGNPVMGSFGSTAASSIVIIIEE